jgi:Tfp pilus assembly protein PilO
MAANPKTLITLLVGAIVGIAPAWFGYLSSHEELKAKYQQTQDEATGGYAALATSVKELQTTATTQHDYVVKLEARLEATDTLIQSLFAKLNTAPVASVHRPAPVASGHRPAPVDTYKQPLPVPTPDRPKFRDLPRDFPDAAAEFAPKR